MKIYANRKIWSLKVYQKKIFFILSWIFCIGSQALMKSFLPAIRPAFVIWNKKVPFTLLTTSGIDLTLASMSLKACVAFNVSALAALGTGVGLLGVYKRNITPLIVTLFKTTIYNLIV